MSGHQQDIISVERAVTLDGLFRERVQRSPGDIAYRWFDRDAKAWQQATWAETAREVARWQQALQDESLQPGDRVALVLRNCREWVIFDQAALSLGLVVVPLYTDDRPENVAYILEDAQVRLLLVQDVGRWQRLTPALEDPDALLRVVVLDARRAGDSDLLADPRVRTAEDWLPGDAAGIPPREGDPAALASIVYTSGTTGRPKGVMLSHYNMLSVAHGALTAVGCYREDIFLSFLPLSHTLERTGGYYLPLMAGATVAYARSVAQLADDLNTVRPTAMIAVPRIFERIYLRIHSQLEKQSGFRRWLFSLAVNVGAREFERQQGRCGWRPSLLLWPLLKRLVADKVAARLGGRLRLVVSGGAAIQREVARTFIGLGIPLLQGYGLTETSPVISANTMQRNEPRSVGPALPGIEVKIGPDSELLVKSPGVMLGYWNNQAATAEMIDADGWLHTGDQAALRDGYIFITGRLKDILVLSNGENISPVDMELSITLRPVIEQVMIVGEGRPYLSALVVMNTDNWQGFVTALGLDPMDPACLHDKQLERAVLAEIKQALGGFPGYAKVRRVSLSLEPWTIENGLLTPTMKVKRAKVALQFSREIEAMYAG